MQNTTLADYQAEHFIWSASDGVGTVTLNRPERKNPLTFDSYAELRDLFRALVYADDIHAVVFRGEGGNFCSGGDVHEIIGPLTTMNMKDLLAFTRMTGDLVKAMRACRQPVISAVNGVCAGAGLSSRWRVTSATRAPMPKWLFSSTKWGLLDVTWARAQFYRALSDKVAPVNYFTSVDR